MTRHKTRKGPRKRRTRTQNGRKREGSGWMSMLFGLAVGLSVAAAIYINDRQPGQVRSAVPAPPESPPGSSAPESPTKPAAIAEAPAPERRFDFYEMLPNFEVVIPEEDLDARPDVAPEPVESPGVYVLQAGSFSNFADADRMKVQLALLGIVSRIQKVTVDVNTYHRVRIGPVQSLEELNRMRDQLRDARIEIMVIRVAE